ncbi:hypothetical protein COOONC_12622 [Cooperia oncophora]
MDSEKYCQILERCYIPFSNNIYSGYGVLVQDNAPAHKSVYTSARLDMWKVSLLDWPPESLDLNPTELVWGNMKEFIRLQQLPFYYVKLLMMNYNYFEESEMYEEYVRNSIASLSKKGGISMKDDRLRCPSHFIESLQCIRIQMDCKTFAVTVSGTGRVSPTFDEAPPVITAGAAKAGGQCLRVVEGAGRNPAGVAVDIIGG